MFFENNRFMDLLAKVGNMIVLSILWVLCCLPIITVGPATIALYYASAKTVRREVGYPTTEFFKAMKENFLQGMFISMMNIFLFLFCYGIYHFSMDLGLNNSWGKLYYILVWLTAIIAALTEFYLVAVISRFKVSFSSAVRMSVYFSSKNLKTEIPMILTLVGVIVVIYVFSPALFFLPGFYAFLMTFSVEKSLVEYTKKNATNSEQYEGMWFMEID